MNEIVFESLPEFQSLKANPHPSLLNCESFKRVKNYYQVIPYPVAFS